MPAFYPIVAISLGIWVLIAAAVLASTSWLAIGVLTIACGVRDLLRLTDISVSRAFAYGLDCVFLLSIWLVLCAFDPLRSKHGD